MIDYETYINRNYKNLGDRFLLTKENQLYGFYIDDENLRTKTSLINDKKQNFFIERSKNQIKPGTKESNDLYNRIKTNESNTQLVTGFEIDADWIEAIQDTAKLYNSTHIRFFNDNGSVRVNLFDYRQYRTDIITLKEQKLVVATELLPARTNDEFSCSILARSFSKLQRLNYDVTVSSRFILLESTNSERFDIEYCLSTQPIVEPILEFEHDSLKENVSLLYSWNNDDSHRHIALKELADEEVEIKPDDVKLKWIKKYYSEIIPRVIEEQTKRTASETRQKLKHKKEFAKSKDTELKKKLKKQIDKIEKYSPKIKGLIKELKDEYEQYKVACNKGNEQKIIQKLYDQRRNIEGMIHKEVKKRTAEKYKEEKGDVMITFLTHKNSKEKYMLIKRKNNHILIKNKDITSRFQNKTTDEVKLLLSKNFQ
ncbi:MAG: hypothetical protein CMP38_04945 [Rickettsiales bacterium]|nr:hypothetical protein [Rickettsiales bacterium]OUW02610.1 MAG: hypothetical protein CBD16_04030 [Betaproteobacteria bacterium TMED156]